MAIAIMIFILMFLVFSFLEWFFLEGGWVWVFAIALGGFILILVGLA